MPSILVVGGSRGLGLELAKKYAENRANTVIATSRSEKSDASIQNIQWVSGIDVASEDAGKKLASALKPKPGLDIVVITAGYFGTESFDEPDWASEVKMYTTSAIGPVFIVHHLVKMGIVSKGAKIILVSSESGSITLRHESEGGGNYGHHASKSALNMVGKLLSLDLKEKGITVGLVHPGFMRTEMTKGVGFDKFWDDGGAPFLYSTREGVFITYDLIYARSSAKLSGAERVQMGTWGANGVMVAVTPTEAAVSLKDWIEKFELSMTGQYWAPRGPRDIGTAEPVLGKNLPTPLQLPW